MMFDNGGKLCCCQHLTSRHKLCKTRTMSNIYGASIVLVMCHSAGAYKTEYAFCQKILITVQMSSNAPFKVVVTVWLLCYRCVMRFLRIRIYTEDLHYYKYLWVQMLFYCMKVVRCDFHFHVILNTVKLKPYPFIRMLISIQEQTEIGDF